VTGGADGRAAARTAAYTRLLENFVDQSESLGYLLSY